MEGGTCHEQPGNRPWALGTCPAPPGSGSHDRYVGRAARPDRAQFIVSFLQERLNGSAPSFDELMAPIAEDFGHSGMSEEDLDALVEHERQAIWDEKNQ